MVKTKKSKSSVRKVQSGARTYVVAQEADGIYMLKLVLYLIIGSQWLRISRGNMQIPLPLGLVVGILFARLDRFQIDRKIEYAILLLSTFIGFWLPLGIEIVL